MHLPNPEQSTSPASFARCRTDQLPGPVRQEAVALAAQVCERLDAQAYLSPRFERYPEALLWRDAQGLSAFMLVDSFVEDGDLHVYLGPLFSRGGAYLSLFDVFLKQLLQGCRNGAIHLLAEAQNPVIVRAFERLFPWNIEAESSARSERTSRFGRRISHLGKGESLYRPGRGHERLVSRLRSRGVDLAAGESQLLLASCRPSRGARLRFRLGVALGMARMR